MAEPFYELLVSRRPFPHDARASYQACSRIFKVTVSRFEDITPEKLQSWLWEAAPTFRNFRIVMEGVTQAREKEGLLSNFDAYRKLLQPLLPDDLLGALFGGRIEEREYLQVSLYSHEEWTDFDEIEAHASASLVRLTGKTLEEFEREHQPPRRPN
ncbi:MAG: hypothetical protein GC129_02785 [Proteobacteria bacterium]|nr:hypothetical protein [Pseudomonadota bacterium]